MRKFIFTFVAIIVIGIIIIHFPKGYNDISELKQSETTIKDCTSYSDEDDSDRLAFWFQHHDSVNHGLVIIAEYLWQLDSAAANGNNAERNKWYRKCEAALIHGFDSIHPHVSASNYVKADSMLSEIAAFFEEDADYSTMGMIVNLDLQNSFLIYRMIAENTQILQYEPSFTTEIEAWNRLQEVLNVFCLGVVNLDWFGGSGAAPASLATRNMIIQSRIDDMKNICRLYRGDDSIKTLYTSNTIEAQLSKSHAEFVRAINRVASSVSTVEESKDYLPEDRLSDYKVLYDKVQNSKSPLKKSIDEWKKTRIKLVGADPNTKRQKALIRETVAAIDSLTKCVYNSQSNG